MDEIESGHGGLQLTGFNDPSPSPSDSTSEESTPSSPTSTMSQSTTEKEEGLEVQTQIYIISGVLGGVVFLIILYLFYKCMKKKPTNNNGMKKEKLDVNDFEMSNRNTIENRHYVDEKATRNPDPKPSLSNANTLTMSEKDIQNQGKPIGTGRQISNSHATPNYAIPHNNNQGSNMQRSNSQQNPSLPNEHNIQDEFCIPGSSLPVNSPLGADFTGHTEAYSHHRPPVSSFQPQYTQNIPRDVVDNESLDDWDMFDGKQSKPTNRISKNGKSRMFNQNVPRNFDRLTSLQAPTKEAGPTRTYSDRRY